jgi:hypothetical protein
MERIILELVLGTIVLKFRDSPVIACRRLMLATSHGSGYVQLWKAGVFKLTSR